MNSKTALFLLCFLWAVDCSGEVSVKLLEMPSEVLIYSPTFLLAEITNEGPEQVVVPTQRSNQRGYFLEISKDNERLNLEDGKASDYGVCDKPVRLAAGDSLILSRALNQVTSKPGIYELRVVLRSDGKCRCGKGEAVEEFECWSGLAQSAISSLKVYEPRSAVDRAAFKYIVEEKKWPAYTLATSEPYRLLEERFPESNYTYISGIFAIAAGGDPDYNGEELIKKHPNNALEPQVLLGLALRRLDQRASDKEIMERIARLPKGYGQLVLQRKRERDQTSSESQK
jgi:hypothetical protein